MLRGYWRVVPFGEIAHQRIDVLRGVDGWYAWRAARGIEIISADNQHGHTIAPGIVNRHGRVLQADRTMAEGEQGFPATLK